MPDNAFVPNRNSGFRLYKKEARENLGFGNMETMVQCFGDSLISIHRSQWGQVCCDIYLTRWKTQSNKNSMQEPSFICKVNQPLMSAYTMPLGHVFTDSIDRTMLLLVTSNQFISAAIFDEDLKIPNPRMKPFISSFMLGD